MTPKQLIESQAAEFRSLSKFQRHMSEEHEKNQPNSRAACIYDGSSKAYAFCAASLESLLKLEGWE